MFEGNGRLSVNIRFKFELVILLLFMKKHTGSARKGFCKSVEMDLLMFFANLAHGDKVFFRKNGRRCYRLSLPSTREMAKRRTCCVTWPSRERNNGRPCTTWVLCSFHTISARKGARSGALNLGWWLYFAKTEWKLSKFHFWCRKPQFWVLDALIWRPPPKTPPTADFLSDTATPPNRSCPSSPETWLYPCS